MINDWTLKVWGPKVFTDLVTSVSFTIKVTGVVMNAAENREDF